jgi:hypothetical protein
MPTKFTSRDVRRWNRPIVLFGSLEEFLKSSVTKSGLYTIKYGETFLDFLFAYRGSDRLVVSFHAALGSRVGVKIPIFLGQKISGDQANLLFVSDPGLYYGESIVLAWFSGAYSCPFPKILPRIVRKFQEDSQSPRLIFSGISGGGFAAMLYGPMFPGSLSLAINPQTKLWRFGEHHVREYLRVCFLEPKADNLEESLKRHITADLGDIYNVPVKNHLLYVQNGTDHHVALHAKPFLDALHEDNKRRVKYLEGHSWGTGHVAPPPAVLTALIDSAVAHSGSWDSLVEGDVVDRCID